MAIVVLEADESAGRHAGELSGLTTGLASDLHADEVGERDVLAAGGLDGTEVRGPRSVDTDATRRRRLAADAPGSTARSVPKADVTAATLSLVTSCDRVGRSPLLVPA